MTELERGREAFRCRDWHAARAALAAADRETAVMAAGASGGAGPPGPHGGTGLAPDDLRLLALASYLTGRDDDFIDALERAHHLHLAADAAPAAARCAFWIGLHLANTGERARAGGWFGRAERLLERAGGDHVERGYLLLPAGLQQLAGGAVDAAARTAAQAVEVAERFDDADLLALALNLHGRALLACGRVEDGLRLLDEAMIGVLTDELEPTVTGLVYCSVIGACRSVYALGRAHEWTAALADWCDRQHDLATYRGECCVYRSELLQFHGAWADAIAEARRAGVHLSGRDTPAAALAAYQQGELHRMRGELDEAEQAYRAASHAGREPQPGLALLRLAQGDVAAAAAAIRRAVAESSDPVRRARLLPAHIEIMLAVDDVEAARTASVELGALADSFGSSALQAMVEHARGAIAVAAGDERSAVPHLRAACRIWLALDAPYDAARARLLIGSACRALGDADGASFEIDAARDVFIRLGAAVDAARADAIARGEPHAVRAAATGGRATAAALGLTRRELEVLALVATGKTNRTIAADLSLSEKTVARHLSNMYMKLGISSRAAATAWAYEHGLVTGQN
jgi:DNA-binding CsgD family transcriptional regulator